MKLPLQITFRNVEHSTALESRVRTLAKRLEKFSDHITSCRVIIESASHRHHHGTLYRVRMIIAVPRAGIPTGATHRLDRSHEDPYLALRDTFGAARRRLEDYERKNPGRAGARGRQPRIVYD